jgi:hypothetical protein
MKFSVLYKSAISEWPSSIDISDGSVVTQDGGLFPELSMHWNMVEAKRKNDNWWGLINWGIFGALHSKAIEAHHSGKKIISVSGIDIYEVERAVSGSLFADQSDLSDELRWTEEYTSSYENDLQP